MKEQKKPTTIGTKPLLSNDYKLVTDDITALIKLLRLFMLFLKLLSHIAVELQDHDREADVVEHCNEMEISDKKSLPYTNCESYLFINH